MIYKKPYAWIASLAAVLLTVAGCILFYEIARVRQSITEEVEGLLDEALHEEYQLRLLSLGIYAEPDPNPDRKIQTYRTRTKEKDTVYVFEEPMNVQTADYLINQHDFADKHPMDINKVNLLLSEKLADANVKGKSGIAYTRNGETLYSGNDSVLPAKAACRTPMQYIDYPPSIQIQAWADYGIATLWHHTDLGNIGAALCCLLGILLLGRKYATLQKKEKIQETDLQAKTRIEIKEQLHQCVIDGMAHNSSRQLLQLFSMFVEADNHFLTREEIRQRFWKDIDTKSADKNLNSHINKLRQLLKPHEGYGIIAIKGLGYSLIIPEG